MIGREGEQKFGWTIEYTFSIDPSVGQDLIYLWLACAARCLSPGKSPVERELKLSKLTFPLLPSLATLAHLPPFAMSVPITVSPASTSAPSPTPLTKKIAPLPSCTSLKFQYAPSKDGQDRNLLLFFHGLGQSHQATPPSYQAIDHCFAIPFDPTQATR